MDPGRQPFLASLSPFARLLFTALLVVACFSALFLAGTLLAFPLFGLQLSDLTEGAGKLTDPRMVAMLRYFQLVQSVGLFLLPPLLAGFLLSGNSLRYLALNRTPRWQALGITLAVMFICLPFLNWLITLNESMVLPGFLEKAERWMRAAEQEAADLTDTFLTMPTTGTFLINLGLIGLLPALGEEMLFRGVIQRQLKEWTGSVHAAVFITAFLFSAMHLQFYGFLPRFALGLLMGYLFVWTGSLWIPIFAHFVNNAAAVVVSWLGQREIIRGDYEEFGATDNVLVILLSAAITALLLFLLSRGNARVTREDQSG